MHEYFAKLGLEPEIAAIYEALHKHGPQNLHQLARNAKVERTRIYRLLDDLLENQLVEIEEHYKRKIYRAAPLQNLEIVLAKREQEIHDLQKELVRLQEEIQPAAAYSPTRVQFYRGSDGVKQMFWNQTRATTENLTFLYANMQSETDRMFFLRWVERCNERNIRFRGVAGDHFLSTQQEWYGKHENEKLKHWQGRYVPASVFPIAQTVVTYDDVVAYHSWKDGEIFGIEVYNQDIANTQRHIFEMVWKQGERVPGHGENGMQKKTSA